MNSAIRHDGIRTQAVAMGVGHAQPAGGAPRGTAGTVRRRRGNFSRVCFVICFVICIAAGLWQCGQGLYIHAKARLAQYLIAAAWDKTLAGQRAVKPWPWADTWPVARLTASAHGVSLYVLAGADGRTIAFGPGHVYGTPLPGTDGNSVIGGHRDTHLAWLRAVKRNDVLTVQRADGTRRDYRVSLLQVVDKHDLQVTRNHGPTRLTLVTCWPFDALRAGGPQRYVVTAVAFDSTADKNNK
jgi:sortase A